MTNERAKKIVDQFSGKKILVVGDMALDRYVFGDVERLNPEAPVPILHALEEKFFTGAAGNTAKNIASLGAEAMFVGVVGDDEASERVKRAVDNEGYLATFIVDPKRPTIEKIRYVVRSQQMFRVDFEVIEDITGNVERHVIDAVTQEASKVDAIIVSDYAKGVITEGVARAIMSAAREHNLIIMGDVKPSRISLFKGVTMISPNVKEAHEYLGFNHLERGGKKWDELSRMLHDQFETTVFLTLSEQGIYVCGDEEVHVPQDHGVEVADGSGCGDTVAAVITLAKLVGATDKEAAELGNAAGAVIASKIGAVALPGADLLQMITHSHI